MKTIAILTLFFSLSLLSCTNRIIFPSHECGECQTYYQFIKDNWVADGDYYYHFKGNPEYWKLDTCNTFLPWKCLIGVTKEQIIQLFGTPSKEVTFAKPYCRTFLIYATTKDCTENPTEIRAGKRVIFWIAASGTVEFVITRPICAGL